MAVSQIQAFKKIFWEFNSLTKEEILAHEIDKKVVSKPFEIILDDIVSKWTLSFVPKFYYNASPTCIYSSLYLSLEESTSFNFDVSYRLEVSKKPTPTIIEGTGTGDQLRLQNANALLNERANTGVLILQKSLLSDGSFANGKIHFICELTLTKKEATMSLNDNFVADCKKMFESKRLSDFEVKSKDGDVIKAHKAILAARSPVFLAMLEVDMDEAKKGFVNVSDFGTKALTELLRYIYCNEIEDIDEIARELIFTAEKYDLEPLKKLCIESIIKTLTADNVVEALMISHRLTNTIKLFDKSMSLIIENYKFLSQTEEWKDLSNLLKDTIIDRLINTISVVNI